MINNHHDKLEVFTGPDGSTLVHRNSELCACEDCEAERWQQVERDMARDNQRRDAVMTRYSPTLSQARL